MSDGLVVLVTFKMRPGGLPKFLELIADNATASVRDEPGCRRFDVLLPEAGGDEVVLYEIYDSPAAFDAHMATPHYATFHDASKAVAANVTVRRLILHEHAKPQR